jgi:myo-inositol-1(or 4)-monophosphatase
MSDALDFAIHTARQAGEVLLGFYERSFGVGYKSSDIDLVTDADLASERLIVDAIRERFPEHDILSEEGLGGFRDEWEAQASSLPGMLWLVDPLDGTVSFAHGYPFWGVTLALAQDDEVVLGVVHDPLREQTFWAERGGGAWCDGQPIEVSTVSDLRQALVATGFAYGRATLVEDNLVEFASVMPRVQGIRRAGAAVLDLAYVAAGRLDGYWEMYLQPWDWAAGQLLVREAGGTVTDLGGGAWSLSTERIVASNGHLHEELLSVLRGAKEGWNGTDRDRDF